MTSNVMYLMEQAWAYDIPDNEMSQEEEMLMEKIEAVKDRMYEAEISEDWDQYDELEDELKGLKDELRRDER